MGMSLVLFPILSFIGVAGMVWAIEVEDKTMSKVIFCCSFLFATFCILYPLGVVLL